MSCGRTGKNSNIGIKKEVTWAVPVTVDQRLRFLTESLIPTIEHATDDSNVGSIYPTEYIKVKGGAGGSIEANCQGDSVGRLMDGVTGVDVVSDPINGFLIVNYNGSANYARLTLTGTNLLAEDSPDGSVWSADTNFGVAGTLDISTTTTMTALNTAIDAYTGWSSSLFGDGTVLTTNIPVFTATEVFNNGINAGGLLLGALISASTTAKTHSLSPIDSTGCLPSFSILVNKVLGTDKSYLYPGSKFSSITVSSENSDIVKISVAIISKEETIDQPDVALPTPTVQAMTSAKMKILVVRSDGSQVPFDEVSSHSVVINTNPDENRNIGSYNINEPVRQSSEIETSFNANNTETQYAVRPDYTDDKEVEMYVYYESTTDIDTTNGIPYSMLIRLNAIKLTTYSSPVSSGDRLMIDAAGKAQLPKGTNTNHIDIFVTDNILTSY